MSLIRLLLFGFLLTQVCIAHELAEPAPAASSMKVGLATRDISPPLPIMLSGYGYDRPTNKISSTLSATAVAVSDGASTPIVLVAVDTVILTRQFTGAVIKTLQERMGLGPGQVILMASHTHSAPLLVEEIDEPGHSVEYVG